MRNKVISLVLVFSVVLTPFGVSAESPSPSPLSPAEGEAETHFMCERAYDLLHGDIAPCSGILWSKVMSLEAIRCKQIALPTCMNDKDFEITKRDADISALSKRLTACSMVIDEQDLLLDDALDSMRPTPWYESPLFWGTVGLVVGVGITVGITYAVSPAF